MKPATELTKEGLEIANRRTARLIIRSGRDDADRERLLEMLGLSFEDASPESGAGVPGPHGPGSSGAEIVLESNAPIVPRRHPDVRFALGPRGQSLTRQPCSHCGQVKPIDQFYEGRRRCKTCHQKANSEAQAKRIARRGGRPSSDRQRGRPRKPRYSEQAKECCRCGEVKPNAKFPADRRTPDGLTSACRECTNAGRRKAAA